MWFFRLFSAISLIKSQIALRPNRESIWAQRFLVDSIHISAYSPQLRSIIHWFHFQVFLLVCSRFNLFVKLLLEYYSSWHLWRLATLDHLDSAICSILLHTLRYSAHRFACLFHDFYFVFQSQIDVSRPCLVHWELTQVKRASYFDLKEDL